MLHIILFFEIYAFLGWIMECFYTRYDELRWVNRGFLHGPVCPIYGLGAVACLVFLAPLQSNLYVFVLTTIFVATTLEYFIGWFFEKVFHVTLWTYSHKRLNLHGRICLEFSLLWGVVGIVFVKLVHPRILAFVDGFEPDILFRATSILTFILMLDLVISIARASVSTERLDRLARNDARDHMPNPFMDTAIYEKLAFCSSYIPASFSQIRDKVGQFRDRF